jgi:hypothetical protein
MEMTTLAMIEAALHEAAKHLIRAAGQDERLSPREFRQKLDAISGEMRDLTDALYRFVVEIDKQGANHITERDIEQAVLRVKQDIFPKFVISEYVIDEEAHGEIQEMAPRSGVTLAHQLYQTAQMALVLPPSQVYNYISAYAEGLVFDALGSEGAHPIEAVRIEANLSVLNRETFAQALGLEADKPSEVIERWRDGDSFLPLFPQQQPYYELAEQAEALVDTMTENLRQIVVAVIGEDNYDVSSEHPVYVLGLAADGSLVGFKSIVIWT